MKQSQTNKDILSLIERLSRLLRAREHETGLNPVQWEALRYLARSNRFSNSPSALTRYLASTKGTVSQTLKALERKGLIEKKKRQGNGRAIALDLSKDGKEILARDPWQAIEKRIAALALPDQNALQTHLRHVLLGELQAGGYHSFGICRTCRHFSPKKNDGNSIRPFFCNLLKLPLAEQDSHLICAEHEYAVAGGPINP